MEHALRFVIVFLWCVCFGFFSVMSYLDDATTGQKSTAILAGLLAGLGVYGAIEWRPKIKGLSIRAGRNALRPLCSRLWHGLRASVTSINFPALRSIRKRFLPTSKPSVSSKSP